MAEFTDQDRRILDILRKAFEKSSRSTSSRQPWQELFNREASQESIRSVLSTDIIEGMSGSWASMWRYGLGSSFYNTERTFLDSNVPNQTREKTFKLGQRGIPEINFSPYDFRTNRMSEKGGSFVGHPISFEVVGPTLKSPFCDWTWQVDLGLGPNGGDLLTLTSRPDGNLPTCTTVLEAYNISSFTIGDLNEPNGGLYLIVTDDGANPGSIVSGLTPMGALPEHVEDARYQIFRIASIDGSNIEIHPSKSFSEYFDLPPGPRYIRAITILKPYVTRLTAIPGSGAGVGREQVFYLVTPERAAVSDLYPPLDGGVPGDGTWLQGGFTTRAAPGTFSATGVPGSWNAKPLLPIPRPIKEGQGTVQSDIGFVSPTPVGQWRILTNSIFPQDIGRVIRILDVRSSRVQEQEENDFAQGNPRSCFGWYEILDVTPGAPNSVLLLRLPETNPETGVIYYGPGPYLQTLVGTEMATVSFTVHDNILSLWRGSFDIDKVDSARLQNLIDPKYIERFQKDVSNVAPGFPKTAYGKSGGRPDRAIFDTRTQPGVFIPNITDPGSLLDLGFRMVLFPAKATPGGPGEPVPDYDRPITSLEVIINPDIEESQYLTIDYSGGSVTLSHAPSENPGGDIIPNGIIPHPTLNPRNEVILFAACVPFSMEDSQKGSSSRVITQKAGDSQWIDSFSEPIEAHIDLTQTNYDVLIPFFGASAIAPNPIEIVLDRIWQGPETGVIEIISGGREDFPTLGTWSYSEIRIVTVSGREVSALGGITSLSNVSDPSINLSTSDERLIRLRREIFFGQRSENFARVLDDFRLDTSYGSSVRSSFLRLENARQIKNPDQSSSVIIEPTRQLWQQWGTWNAANVATGGLSQLGADGVFSGPAYFENGVQILVGNGFIQGTPDGQMYQMEVVPLGGNNKALATNNLILQPQMRFRLVTKFRLPSFGGPSDALYYIGLLNTNIGSILNDAFASPINPATAYIGIRLEGDIQNPLDLWRFVIQNPVTATTRQETFQLNPDTSYYFILETEQDGRILSTGVVPYRLKVSILDQNMNSFFKLLIPGGDPVLPVPDANMNYFAGLEFLAGGSRRSLGLQMSSYVTRIDLPGPKIGLI